MPEQKEITRISKFLSLVLRHRPEMIGIVLEESGWTSVESLIERSASAGMQFDRSILATVVETNNKKRFAFDDTGEKIRANQGHSVDVELGYAALEPPQILYHGTAEKFVNSIQQTGLEKRDRHHVHLSTSLATAVAVGQRHGKPVVFEVMAGAMYREGFIFYQSENAVWLTESVPGKFLQLHQIT